MPLVIRNDLPTYQRLQRAGLRMLPRGRALQQDIRELHIGLLNMMPDAALEATERQFFRLVGESNPVAQLHIHPFTLKEIPRSPQAQAHVERYYDRFEQLQQRGLDALIITGANVSQPDLEKEVFWQPLKTVLEWAWENTCSILCSCLATHAVMQACYGQRRTPLERKCWGVYRHRVIRPDHPLVFEMNTVQDVPHSRYNQISREQFEAAGLHVLIEGEQGVHMATSPDGFRMVLFQGHPEYDTISLLKEYKREVVLHARGERPDYPPFPEHFFPPQIQALLDEYRERLEQAAAAGQEPPPFPEHLIVPRLDNTWHDSAEGIINNWIGQVYQLTHVDPTRQFMDGVDPQDPLGWLAGRPA